MPYKHYGRLPPDFTAEDYLRDLEEPKVFDRFHVSEMIYSVIRKEKSKVSPALFAEIHKYDPVVVIITEDSNEYSERLYETPDEMFDSSLLLRANRGFTKYAAQTLQYPMAARRYWINLGHFKKFPDIGDLKTVISLWRDY